MLDIGETGVLIINETGKLIIKEGFFSRILDSGYWFLWLAGFPILMILWYQRKKKMKD